MDQSALQVLLYDYYITREDEQQFQTVIATLISVAVALLAAIIALFYQSCDFSSSKDCLHIRSIVYAGLPFGPLVILAYLGMLSNIAAARNFYLRALERKLHEYAQGDSVLLEGSVLLNNDGQVLPVPMFTHLAHAITSQRHGLFRYRYLNFSFYAAMGVLFLGVTATSVANIKSAALQVGAGVVYGVTTVVFLLVLWSGSIGGRMLWQRLTERLDEARHEPLVSRSHIPARLWAYLLLPRPAELITKGLFIPIAAMIALVVFPHDRPWSAVNLISFVFAFEWLAYQARYMLNDIRNLDEDVSDPMAASRNRLPSAMSPQMLKLTLGAMTGRLLGWLVVVIWLWRIGLGLPLLISGLVVFVIAGLYEGLRARVRKHTDPAGADILDATLGKSAIYVVVGFGYALRALTGIWIGGQTAASLPLLLSAAVSMSAFGTMFVVMTWVIVGTSYIEPLPNIPRFPSQRSAESLVNKSHYGPLLSRAGLLEAPLTLEATVAGATTERPFLEAKSSGLDAVWNKAFAISVVAASSLGLLLSRGSGTTPPLRITFALILGGIGGTVSVSIGPKPAGRFAVTLLVPALLLAATARLSGQRFWWVSAIPYTAICVLYIFFCRSCAQDLAKWSQWPRLAYAFVATRMSTALERSVAAMLGPSAAKILREGRSKITH